MSGKTYIISYSYPGIVRVIIKIFFILLLLSHIFAGSAEAAYGQLRNLTEAGTFTTHDPHDAEFYQNYMYIADGNSILIYNISDPERPKLVNKFSDFNDPRQVNGISISGDRLYTASGAGWIYVLNISDPEKPEKLYQLDYLDSSNDVAVQGEYMFVADANTGLLIFDLYNRRDPSLVGMFYILRSNASGSLQGWGGISLEVSGKYAFLSGDYNEGFYIIDISNKSAPRGVYHSLGKNVYDIAVSGNYVFLARADGTTDFDILNISNISAPVITGNFSIPDMAGRSAIAIHPSKDYLYAASDDTWHIFRMQDTHPQIIIEDKNKTALDKKDNNMTEIMERSNNLPEQTVLTTPEIVGTVTMTEGKNTAEKTVSLNIIYVAFIFIALIVIVYMAVKHKKKD